MFTYSGNPEHSPLEEVRFLLGDTDPGDVLLQDQEIKSFLDNYNQAPLNAAIRCCEAIIAKLSRRVNERVGSVSVSYSDQAKQYRSLLIDLKKRLATTNAAPYAGGLSRADKQSQNANTDRVRPDFTKHMMENREVSPFVGGDPFNRDVEGPTGG